MNFSNIFSVDGKAVLVIPRGQGTRRRRPGQCIALRADLSQDEDITTLVKTLTEREGMLDVLVNNAALGNVIYRFEEFPMHEWDRVNAIAPGPFPGKLDEILASEEGRTAVSQMTVVGRPGEPEDMGAACLYLASRAGEYVTGAVLPVDGGLLVGRDRNA